MRTEPGGPGRELRLLLFVLPLAGACAALEPTERIGVADAGTAVNAAIAAEAARLEALKSQSAAEPQYLRFRAEDTQLMSAQDDGHLTYLAFASPVDSQTRFFDHEGRLLPMAGAGRVAAVTGVHRGILVQRADRASFVSPNPRALSLPRRPLPELADYAEARAKLESEGGQLLAMQRAQDAARAQQGAHFPMAQAVQAPLGMPLRPAPHSATQAVPQPVLQPGHQPAFQPGHQPGLQPAGLPPGSLPARALLQSARLTPGSGAQASVPMQERGMVRLYFATASRAIVAPDDGLGLLLREAANADEIRVTGYTDATGSRAANEALAFARADAVVQILLRRGIPGDRLFRSAVGAADFVADNESDRGRALNRRVEVLLLRNGAPLAFGDAMPGVR